MCDYCTTDRDGYSRCLPRKGTGNAHIKRSLFNGTSIDVSGPNKTSLEIPINFCPLCGRELRRKHENKNSEG